MGPMAALGLLVCAQLCAGSGELRLVGGGGRCAGRVEVKHGGEWGSVCVFDFHREARWAIVVCRQLGCGQVAKASPYAPFGQGTGRIWLQPFCRGTEEALEECPHFGWGQHFCGHESDAGVTCRDAVELRLAGGGSPCAGRVEVKLRGRWGSVGDDFWDMEDAEVVCQHLGCGSAAGAYFAREIFGAGDGPVSLANVDCKGNESTLWDCEIRGWGPYGSLHNFDTAVTCQGFSRLVGGDGACAGRLEVRQGRAWVGVCEDQVDMKVAQVVCRELGCGAALSIPGSERFGAGSGPLWDGGLQCNGTEPVLSACARHRPHSQGCSTGPASVICSRKCRGHRGLLGSLRHRPPQRPFCHSLHGLPAGQQQLGMHRAGGGGSEGDVGLRVRQRVGAGRCARPVPPPGLRPRLHRAPGRLLWQRGRATAAGRLRLQRERAAPGRVPRGRAGEAPLCPRKRRCRQLLRCVRHLREVHEGLLGPPRIGSRGCRDVLDSPSEMDIMTEEMDILDVGSALTSSRHEKMDDVVENMDDVSGMGPAPTSSPEGMVIVCSGSRRVRLVGSSGRCAGRVEVYSGGTWSAVCQEGWELRDAAVVCRELGCGTALEAPRSARFGAGPGPLWPYIPACSGSEESLWECGRSEGRECGRGGGAGAVCSEQLSVRLAGGRGRCRGFLEVSHNGTWGRVCANGTSPGTANTVCQQLGCGPRGWLSAVPAQQPAPAWLAWVGCEDGARSLWGCPSAPWNLQSCGPGGDAHVACDGDSDGIAETDTTPHPDGATSTGVRGSTAAAVTAGTVPVPTVLCVVLGTLLCVALGALAVLLCRARAWRRGPGRAADAVSNAVYEELDYTAMPEYQEVPSRPGSLSEGSVKKLPYYTGDSVEGSDTEASPEPPARPEHGTPDGYDDALGVPQEPPAPSTGDMSEGVAQRRWICVLPTGGIYSPPSAPGATRTPSEQPPVHTDYDDVGSSALGPHPAAHRPPLRVPAPTGPALGSVPCVRLSAEQVRATARCRSARQRGGTGQGSSSVPPPRSEGPRDVLLRKGPRRPGAVGGLSPPGDIRVAAHCGGLCDARSGGEPHIWARSRLLEAAAPQPGDEALIKGALVLLLPPLARALPRHPLAARGSAPGPWGRWRRWGCWCARSCVRVSAGRRERGPRRWRARLSSLRAAGSGELRLVGGGGRCAGRVEVKHGGEWGSVCVFDFDWEARWAIVVCRQLGCGRVAKASTYAPFGQGTGRIWLQPFFCRGTEEALEKCPHFGWGQHFCGHESDVGVTCRDAVELRLAGGGSPCAGRVEVKLRGRWGSVGDDFWDMEDAEVVCQHLGCGSAAGAYSALERFGAGDGPVSLANVNCKGNESTLWDCEIRGWGPYGSLHNFDTAVTCQGRNRTGEDVALHAHPRTLILHCSRRIFPAEGRAWVGVCEDQVDMKVAQVVCRELGCGAALSIPGSERFGAGSGPLWDGGLQCNGTEPLLSACARHRPHSQGCSTGPASVICSRKCRGHRGLLGSLRHRPPQRPFCHSLHGLPAGQQQLGMHRAGGGGSEGDVGLRVRQRVGAGRCARPVPPPGLRPRLHRAPGRLLWQRGRATAAGRLRLQRERAAPGRVPRGRAGEAPLCPRKRRCRQLLRCVRHLREVHEGLFGPPKNWEQRMQGCFGVKHGLSQVPQPHASAGDFAGVGGFVESLRLVEGQSLCDGRLEETITSPAWRRVPVEQWKSWDVHMVCAVLGCGVPMDVNTSLGTATVVSSSPSEMDIMTEEMDILDVGSALTSSRHEKMDDVVENMDDVSGMGPAPTSSPEGMVIVCSGSRRVRLVGSSGRCAGRVEVYSGGTWSAVCQEGWELRDAAVVCRELGCGTALEAPSSARFGAGPGPLWPYIPACSGSEESLWECGRSEGRECGRGGGAGAVCSEQLSVRLAGGRGRCRGFLEVSHNGTWGRVCANGTSPGTANTVCQQLGCGPRGWLSAVPAQQPAPAWLAWVGCEDGARSLWGCPSAPWNLQSCGPGGDAHVACDGDSDGIAETDTTPHPDGATSTGVRGSRAAAVTAGTVPVPTVLCVVLGTLLCVALGALAVLLCRARAWRRGPGRAADAVSNAVYEELDYTAMPEYQEVPSRPGSLSEGSVKKLPYYTGDSVEGSDTEASPEPPARPEHGTPDGYDDALGVPQEPPAPSTGDMSEGVAQRRWICVLPTGGIYSPPSAPGATRTPSEQPPVHTDYDDVGSSALGPSP
ncbi:deleted in malignant brain tumors 1 protein-like [Corvus hawaiiensis]|uniref:deleted in malignant brain tumors 1 protein-like n=1 Tax=Corvus hawaiiensis TaxID=134902 RepID=UPI0020199C0D|nr:deleted in malignant brain tumors 1 protein-like [Corvus hawaiiensis]